MIGQGMKKFEQNNDQPPSPRSLSKQAEQTDFSDFLSRRLYGKKNTKVIPKRYKKFVAVGKKQEKKELPPVLKHKRPSQADILFKNKISNKAKKELDIPLSFTKSSKKKKLKSLKRKQQSLFKESNKSHSEALQQFIEKIQKNQSSLEFVYLNRSKEESGKISPFNPYDLVIVPHSEINRKNYYTLGAKGVTHFVDGTVEFTTLQDWLKEKELYKKVLDLSFFRKYRIFKSFYYIRKLCVTKRMTNSKRVLKDFLFLLHPVFSKPLKLAKQICLDIREIQLFKDITGKTLSLKDFRSQQVEQKEYSREILYNKINEIAEIVSKACKISMKEAGFGERRKTREKGKKGRREEEEQMSYTDLSQKRRECRKIVNFVKLIDYIIIDALLDLIKASVRKILERVHHLTKNTKPQEIMEEDELSFKATNEEDVPIFRVSVQLEDNDKQKLVVKPSKMEFEKLLNTIIEGYVEAVSISRIITREEFAEYVDLIKQNRGEDIELSENQTMRGIISQEESMSFLVDSIQGSLDESSNKVDEYIRSFNSLRKIYIDNKKMDITQLEKSKHQKSIMFFNDEIQKYKTQIEQVDGMPSLKHCGMFAVDSKTLKSVFKPSPRRCLSEYHSFLPRYAETLNQLLFSELKKGVAVLSTSPSTIEEFVGYCKFLSETKEKKGIFEERHIYITQLYELLDRERVEIKPGGKESFLTTTTNKFHRLKKSIDIADESHDERRKKFGIDISDQFTQLKDRLKKIQVEGRDLSITDVNSNPSNVISFLQKLKAKISEITERANELINYQEMFKLISEELSDVDEINDDIELKLKLWNSLEQWEELTQQWRNTPFEDIVSDNLKKMVEKYAIVSMQVEKGIKQNVVVDKFSGMVEEWKVLIPVITNLKNPHFKNRHLRDLDKIFGETIFTEIDRIKKLSPNEKKTVERISLGEILVKQVIEKAVEIEDVSSRASNEANLDEMVKKIASHWDDTLFDITHHKEYYILGDAEEIITMIEDDQIVISMILASPFVKPIKQKVEKWQHDLKLMLDIIQQWTRLQSKWLYLESVFSSGDSNMQSELSTESAKFKEVSKFFKDQMKRTNEGRNVLSACTQNMGLLDRFNTNNKVVEEIEKSLEMYLDRKRNMFPRLYFLSNEDLLDILSSSKNPRAVQPHLEKCFDNIKKLRFVENGIDIISMISAEGEEVKFRTKNLKGRGAIEDWLKSVEKGMLDTLKHLTKQGIKDYLQQEKHKWISEHKCQVVLTVNQIFWVREVEKCLLSPNPLKALEEYKEQSKKNLNGLAILSRQDLPPLVRFTVKTLIILEVHGNLVVENLIKEKVDSITDFGWLQQLRYYWDQDEDDCLVKQSNSVFHYGYEYIGCKGRLVITPLTDRIYMTMTGALHLHMGGAPAGPAGTGKTETVKDLAKALGYQCVVFNCSEGITFQMMYKFFTGIVQTGAWTCFDEFNRINIEVLSVVATQVLTIFDALKKGLKTFDFEEGKDPIVLKPTSGIFITMNPGYAGRSELPDNLKALFRPVACMIPDYQIIAQVILLSEGYEDAKTLSRKMVQLYKLSNEQLSPQCHYDFGMRAIKSVLVMAGELKRKAVNEEEEVTLMKAMRDSNLPKFVGEDIELFNSIVSDLFPNLELGEKINKKLNEGILKVIKRKQLQPVPNFILKIIQLYDTMIVRHGVMVVGPSGSGKTMAREILADTLTHLKLEEKEEYEHFQKVRTNVMNPKSINYSELYGEFNLVTHQFSIGLIPHFAKIFNKDATPDQKWIIFDGPVDTLWIESMNSVLDDSRILCLDNGDTIRLNKTLHMLFEVEDLSVASPATVSRCGMVWMDQTNLGWKPYIDSWIEKLDPKEYNAGLKKFLKELFDETVEEILDYVRSSCRELIPSTDLNLVSSLCDFMSALLQSETIDVSRNEEKKNVEFFNNLFMFALTWSIGGNIIEEERIKFDNLLQKKMQKRIRQPLRDSIYNYYFDLKANHFLEWSKIVPGYEYKRSTPFYKVMVPTVDTIKYSYFSKVLANYGKPVLLNGTTGVGKTAIISNTFAEAKKEGTELVTVQFSARTTSHRTKISIQNKLVKRKNRLQPPAGMKRVALFIDDINMPEPEEFGAQPPVEFVRQFLQYKGFYDLDDRENIHWEKVKGLSLISACGPAGGGRYALTTRLVRMFHLLNTPDLSPKSMTTIFSCILNGFLLEFDEEIKTVSKSVIKSSIELYTLVRETFRPTPKCPHYTFNLRDLSNVFHGIVQVTPSEVKNAESFIRLWIHESKRCFYDRIAENTEREAFQELVMDMCKRYFKTYSLEKETLFGKTPVLFGSIMKMNPKDKTYEEIKKIERVPKVLDDHLANYNIACPQKLDLVFFEEASLNLMKIVRILKQQRGNALLVGVGGVGKQSLTRLATQIVGGQVIEIKLKRKYTLSDFREDLQGTYRNAGLTNKKTVFLLTENQIVQNSFLEDINNILNSGEVPNLFPSDLKEEIINELRKDAREANISEQREEIWKFFIERVRNNLHIVLCLSPIGDKFRNRCRMFPSLVNCCTIIWFDEWSKDAILSVCKRKYEKIRVNSDYKEKLINMTVDIHELVLENNTEFYKELKRRFYITPAAFLEFIETFNTLMEKKRSELSIEKNRLTKGLHILQKTNEDVKKMKIQLEELKPQLEVSSEETKKNRELVTLAKNEAAEKQKIISAEQKIVHEKTKNAEELANLAKNELSKALPDLREAENKLGGLTKGAIAEIKNYNKPPDAVEVVLEAAQVLFGSKNPTFQDGVKLLSSAGFVTKCKDFNAKDIKESILKTLKKKYLNNKLFDEEVVEHQSQAAAVVCKWIRAVVKFNGVFKKVVPLKTKKEEAEKERDVLTKQLRLKQKELSEIEKKVDVLNKELEENTRKMTNLEEETKLCKKRLASAEKLTNSLGIEQVTWSKTLKKIKVDLENLPGNILIASAGVVYFGPFTAQYRSKMMSVITKKFIDAKIPISKEPSLIKILGDPVTIRDWNIAKLPSDKQSIENAIITTNTNRWPLCIDPQSQANNWIRTMKKKTLKPLVQRGNFIKDLENLSNVGTPVLLENVGSTLDPSLDPFLDKQPNDSSRKFNENFKLYITTKLSNPHYLPDICNKLTLINFMVTERGLEEQLLSESVQRLEKELEESREALIFEMGRNEKMLKNLRKKILSSISSVGDRNILDDEKIIKDLDDSKFLANVFEQRVKEAVKQEAEIKEARKIYRSLAIRGSLLYFVITKVANIDPMYQYSLEYFKQLFNSVIEKTSANFEPEQGKKRTAEETKKLLDVLSNNVTMVIYENISRGLFEKDKLVLSFLFALSILKGRKEISDEEIDFFVRGTPDLKQNSKIDFIDDSSWGMLVNLEKKIFDLCGICDDIEKNKKDWKEYLNGEELFEKNLPGKWSQTKRFQKLLLIKCLKESVLIMNVRSFIKDSIGEFFIKSAPLDLKKSISMAKPTTPITFILSSGVDPTDIIKKFAIEEGFENKLLIQSLGQGQEESAKKKISKGRQRGYWVMLQNCHLAISFMPELEQIISNLGSHEYVDQNFRLWLTSMPNKDFPITILQNGIKITLELPKGIRSNLLRSFNAMDEKEYFDSFQESEKFPKLQKSIAFKKLLTGLTIFNAVIQERKKFGPTGWTKIYEFNDADLKVAKMWLQIFLKEHNEIPWKSLRYTIGEICYGGRVTDPFDSRLILDILDQYFSPKILEPTYKWSEDENYYTIPQYGSLGEYKKYVQNLPDYDPPDIFKMHKNADTVFQLQEGSKFLETMKKGDSKSLDGKEISVGEKIKERIKEIAKKLPNLLLKEEAGKNTLIYSETGALHSLSSVLLHEMSRFNKLLKVIDDSLKELLKALDGLVVLSSELEKMLYEIMEGKVPTVWKNVAYPSLKGIDSWLDDLKGRVEFMKKWLEEGLPNCFPISSFFFPQGFLTGVLQTYARKYKIPVDTLSFGFKVLETRLEDLVEQPEDGVYIYGMHLDGARWNKEKGIVEEAEVGGKMINPIPVIHFLPEKNHEKNIKDYVCPLYKTSERKGTLSSWGQSTNFVVSVELPTEKPSSFWTLQGLAMICQLDK